MACDLEIIVKGEGLVKYTGKVIISRKWC